MSINPNVSNVLRTYWRAKPDEIHEGLAWYRQAAEEACRRIPDFPRDTVLAVIASLSPQTSWPRNIKYAEMPIYEGRCPSTSSRIATAIDILGGQSPDDRLGGPKVRSFFACLRDQDTDAVCVDGHAYSCWAGERIATSKCPHITERLYRVIANDFREAAGVVGVMPHQLQAVTWLTWRRLHGVRKEIDRDLGKTRERGAFRVRVDGAHSLPRAPHVNVPRPR